MNASPRWCVPFFLLTVLVGASDAHAAKKNVVLFVADDLSPDAGCYGNSVIKTPHLDQLAAEGIRFRHAFCTTASCSASRSVILTGLYNHANAQYGHEHSYHHFRAYDHVKSLPVLLSQAGYRTGRIGKLHVGPDTVFKFDETFAGNARSPVEMADNCRAFVSSASEQPFFLYFCTADPHRDGGVAPGPHPANSFGNRPKGFPGVDVVRYEPRDVLVPPFLPDTPVCRAELAQYYQSVSRVDQGLGRLVRILKEAGVYDDTLLIVTSDHGMAFPGAKTTLYEGGMRIPFVVRCPGTKPGGWCDALISLSDVTPTILDFAAASADKKLPPHGRSFLKTLGEERPSGWDEVYASHTFHEITMYYPMRVIRTRQHKLIWNIAHGLPFPFASDLWDSPTWQDRFRLGKETLYGKRTVQAYIHRAKFELYDLEHDPDEVRNLADDPKHANLLGELQTKLRSFQKRTKDPWELKWEYE